MTDDFLDVVNIKLGSTNYKEICSVSGEKEKKGKSRQIQEDKFSRYFQFEKQGSGKGQKWNITEIYKTPLPKVDGRINNGGAHNTIYGDILDNLVLSLVERVHMVEGTFTYFKKELMMCGDDYNKLCTNFEDIAGDLAVPYWYIHDFYINTRSMFKRAFEGSLKRLVKQDLITVEKTKIVMDIEYNYRDATDDDIKAHKAIKEKVLLEMGIDNEQSCIFRGQYSQYLENVSDMVLEELEIIMMFDKYEIIKKDPLAMFDVFPQKFDTFAPMLNNLFCENIINNAKKRKLKAIENVEKKNPDGFIENATKSELRKIHNIHDYVKIYTNLVDRYINVKITE